MNTIVTETPRTRISKRLGLGVAALCAVLLFNALASYFNISRLLEAERRVNHALQIRQALTEVVSAVFAAEAAKRGFLLAPSPAFLEQHRAALESLRLWQTTLRALTQNSAIHTGPRETLERAIEQKSQLMRKVIETRERHGLEAALAIVVSGEPVMLLERVRSAAEAMDRGENAELRAQTHEVGASVRATIAGVVIFTLASLVLILLVMHALRRDARNRAASQQALFSANQLLRLALDNIPQRVFWKDRESRFLGGNRLFARDAGHSNPDLLVGKTDEDTAFAPHAEAFRADDKAVIDSGIAKLNYEESITQPDGSAGWIETNKVPLRDAKGDIVGVLGTYYDITERKRHQEELERHANYDLLTGLPNRTLLSDRLNRQIAHARRAGQEFALAVVDLDHFKLANDGHGHSLGDDVLVEVARRLQTALRADDTVARYGGDEFVLLFGCQSGERFVTVLERVLDAIARPIVVGEVELFVTGSIGVSTYPQDGEDARQLLSHADAAMYRAKEAGRNRFEVFQPEMTRRIQERISLERGLRAALERNEIFLEYQPQLDLRSGRIRGIEALARWKHPEQGLISPGRFIPIAEESGLIVQLGAHILRLACLQVKAWNDRGLGPLTVAVNLSAIQFRQSGFVEFVARTLEETGLHPEFLELEITESLLMSEADDALCVLTRLNEMKICLSIDDFGTGYSSLSYLKRLPVDKLKIDQSFVREIPHDPDDVAIARAIISLAHSMELGVIAEGVETIEQYEFLEGLQCDEVQGYYFSRPVSPDRLEPLLAERNLPRAARRAV